MFLNRTVVTEEVQTNEVLGEEDRTSPTYGTTDASDAMQMSRDYDILDTLTIIRVIVSVIAIIGNSLTFCICMRKCNRKKSFMMYLAALAFFDTLNSFEYVTTIVDRFPNFCLPPDLHCKLVALISNSSFYISSWLIVAISLERAISTKIPHHVAKISSRSFGFKTIFLIVVIAFLLNSHYLYGLEGKIEDSVIRCFSLPDSYAIQMLFFHSFCQLSLCLVTSRYNNYTL